MIKSESQILITGCYRSGTEYITHLLGNQPKLQTEMYVTNFMRYYWGEYDPVAEPANYLNLVFDAAKRTRRRWGRQIDPHLILDQCNETETVTYSQLYDLMMSDLVLTDDARHWAEKTQLVWTKIPEFVNRFDNGKAILIVRDPRSVLASFKNYTYEPEPAYLGAIFNMLSVFQSATRYAQELSDDEFHLIRYEDVVYDPEATLRETYDFLGLTHNHDLLSEEGWTDPSGESWHSNSAFENKDTDKFDKEAAVNRWKQLDEWEVSLCQWVLDDMMSEFGYKPAAIPDPDKDARGVLRNDPELNQYLMHWQETGQGVESYPSDPHEPDNWTENVETE